MYVFGSAGEEEDTVIFRVESMARWVDTTTLFTTSLLKVGQWEVRISEPYFGTGGEGSSESATAYDAKDGEFFNLDFGVGKEMEFSPLAMDSRSVPAVWFQMVILQLSK